LSIHYSSVFYKGKDLNRFKYAIFLLIFGSICSHAYALDPASHPIRQAGQVACPSRDFSEFIKAFSENTEMQAAFTKYPLQQQRLDTNAEPEPKPVIRKLRRDQVSFPVFPNEAERKKRSLVLRIDEKKYNHVKLTLVKDDTDYQVNYFFSRNSCWRLERIEDWSL
jgi:predicted DNA binding CopG/RHH family protein